MPSLKGEIRFEGVSFSYGDEEPALSGVDLRIPAGQTVAFVGETGAGKSTLVKLVARFYDPTEGRVTADGTDLRELDLTAYRHRLGVVPQEAYLFPGTVRDAIAFGRPDATDAEVEAAARAVGAHDDDRHPSTAGTSTRSPSRGRKPVGGPAAADRPGPRRTRVDPDVLLLDEATAALDLATEAQVTRATERLAGAARHWSSPPADHGRPRGPRVVVMDHGRVAEDGTHEELLARGGRYAELCAHAFMREDEAERVA